jgi:hypothetical protein
MSERPGILAVWNDRYPEIADFYENWYVNQHLPERVGLPGWLVGRRYEAMADSSPQFFTYYETTDASAMYSDAYVARLNSPTPETVKVMQNWGNMTRTSCEVHSMRGDSRGACLVAVRIVDADIVDTLEHIAMRAMDETNALSAAVWTAYSGDSLTSTESEVRATPDGSIRSALIVHLMRPADVAGMIDRLQEALQSLAPNHIALGAYQFLCEYRPADAS